MVMLVCVRAWRCVYAVFCMVWRCVCGVVVLCCVVLCCVIRGVVCGEGGGSRNITPGVSPIESPHPCTPSAYHFLDCHWALWGLRAVEARVSPSSCYTHFRFALAHAGSALDTGMCFHTYPSLNLFTFIYICTQIFVSHVRRYVTVGADARYSLKH